LEWREPVVSNVNWYMLFKAAPWYLKSKREEVVRGYAYTEAQLQRAATLIYGCLTYNQMLVQEAIPPETAKFGPLCMNQSRRLFGITRVPALPYDKLVDRGFPPQTRNVLVMVRDHMFNVPMLNADGTPLSMERIYSLLKECVSQSCASSSPTCLVPILTTEHRDTWAVMREKLLTAFPHENGRAFQAVEDSLFAVGLDDVDPPNVNAAAEHSLHGTNGRNRWFDKCLTLWVSPSTQAGGNGEHSPCDAIIPNQLMQYVLEREEDLYSNQNNGGNELTQDNRQNELERIEFKVTPEVLEAITMARLSAERACQAMGIVEGRFGDFGHQQIKEQLQGVGADGLFQASLQLAYYRLRKTVCPTYETASTRQFRHGRTETIRACTPEALQMVQHFEDKSMIMQERGRLVRQYLASHKAYLVAASQGQGCDRHLLGLRCMLRTQEPVPTMFDAKADPAYYWRSLQFHLSTSNVSPGTVYDGLGFGPATPIGFGINYSIAPRSIRFSVCVNRRHNRDDPERFHAMIQQALRDLFRVLLSSSADAKIPQSKL
jgi:hypothetical protein